MIPLPRSVLGTMVIVLPFTVIVMSTVKESKARISTILSLFALAGLTADVKVAVMVAFGGTLVAVAEPRPTLPATSELKDKTVFSAFLVQLNTPIRRIKLIKPENRKTGNRLYSMKSTVKVGIYYESGNYAYIYPKF